MTGLMTSLSIMMRTGWIGLEHLPTTGVMVLAMTGHSWTGMATRTGMTMVGMTAGPGVLEVTPLALQLCPSLSNQLHPAAFGSTSCLAAGQTAPNVSALHSTVNVTDLGTGEMLTRTPSRRAGTVTRPVPTGTGLLCAFVSVIAVMNSFGRPQALPLIPETVSPPEVATADEYDDVLGRHHENCISSLSPKERWILFDSGAAAHCRPLDYAPDYPLLPVGKNPPRLKSVTLFANYFVCDVPFCIVSVARMLLENSRTVLTKDPMKLLTPQHDSVDITRHGTLLYLTPDIVPYHPDMKIVEEQLGNT